MTRAKTTTYKKLSGSLLREIAAESIPLGARGSVADYIPELARVRRGLFSISCATHKGEPLEAGDTEHFLLCSPCPRYLLSRWQSRK